MPGSEAQAAAATSSRRGGQRIGNDALPLLVRQIGEFIDYIFGLEGHGIAPAIHATSSTTNNTAMSLLTSITNIFVNYKW